MESPRQKITDLSPEKRAELERRLLQRQSGSAKNKAIPQRGSLTPCPASFAQQRLWFMDQFLRGSAAYNVPRAYRLQGKLDVAALEQGINDIIQRQESLRTTFSLQNGDPVQIIHPASHTELTVINLADLPADRQEAEVQRLLQEETNTGFNLEQGPLLRTRLLRIDNDIYILVIVLHHVISDGWSQGILFRELSAFYNARCHGQPASLPELPIQYADFSIWQKSPEQERELAKQLVYWKAQLSGLAPIDLPTDRPRQAVQTFNGSSESFEIPTALTDKLRALSQKADGTLYMTLLAAVQILLQRYSGTDDVAVGSPIAGRSRTELEGLIGFFINTLVMRTDLSGNPTFRQLLARVRETALGAYTHQSLPFERLVEVLLPNRDLSRNPLFQVMFVLQNAPSTDLQLEGLVSSRVITPLDSAKFDLTIEFREEPGGLQGRINYNTDLFDQATIARMIGHLQTLLANIVASPERHLSELQILTSTEQQQLLTEWNDTATEYPKDICTHVLFEQQASESPEAVAIVEGDNRLAYGALNRQANRLANYLVHAGITPGTPIAVCLERSTELIIALIAILKAGGSYVPLDPTYPRARLAFMLEDTGAPALLVQQSLRPTVPDNYQGHIITLDGKDAAAIALESENTPASDSQPEQPAYIIYTSGSTGTPKGVVVPHRAINRLVRNTDYIEISPLDAIAQVSNISFDAATFEVWGALLNGARLVVTPREQLLSAADFSRVLTSHGITTLFLTTALFNQLVAAVPRIFSTLNNLLFGGEAVDPIRVRQLISQYPPKRLLHVYGPTESTTFATWYEINQVPEDAVTVPIGRPLNNTTAYVLDAHMNPVPAGVPGELCIGGDGLALGYHNRPELTNERFVADPFGPEGARLYKTGDLVRYRTNGNIEFLGRLDDQVKLRGFRIETGEIETALRDLPEVSQAVVILREDKPGEKQLVAYTAGDQVIPETTRTRLREQLPEYMIPAAFVTLRELPLTANGKIDKSALPPPEHEVMQSNKKVLPGNKLELHLVKLWEELLGTEPIGVTDDFFALGGHSLLAARLFDEIQRLFGKKLPLDTLWFGGATIEHLAQVLSADESTVTWPTLIQIKEGGDRPPLFCVHTQGGNLFHYYDLANEVAVDQPVYGLQAQGVYGSENFHHRIEDIAAHCIDTMRAKLPNGPYLITGFSSGGLVAFEMAQQLLKAGIPPAMLALVDTFPPHIRRRRHYWGRMKQLVRLDNLRYFQERIYHAVMHPLHMGRFRNFSNSGEAHRWAQWSYRTKYYPGAVTLFLAEVSNSETKNSSLGWDQLTPSLHIYTIPGTHGMMVKPPHVTRLATLMQSLIDASETETTAVEHK